MGKFLFTVPPLAGHVNPTLGLGLELLKNGHEVAWVSFDPNLKKRIPEGGTFFMLESDMNDSEKERIKEEMLAISKKTVYGLDSLKFLYDEVLLPMNEGMLSGIRKTVDTYKPNVIINDQQIFAGGVVAMQQNIPYITSVTTPAAIKASESLPMVYEWEGEQIISFQKKAGIDKDERIDCSRDLTIVYTSHILFGDYDLPEHYKFIGPIIKRKESDTDFDWERLNEKKQPKILISIGTTFDHSQKMQFFSKVVEAFSEEDITVVVISDPDLFQNIPSNFMIYKQIPQLEVIPHMDAVVCHGGQNTVCEALSHAKPLVILPIAYDQSYVATSVVNSGAGIRLNFNRFRANHLKEAVHTVITDKQYQEKARAIQKSFVDAGGANRAVKYIEEIMNIPNKNTINV